ncbi:unnamed protein product [Calypogeia fissa]
MEGMEAMESASLFAELLPCVASSALKKDLFRPFRVGAEPERQSGVEKLIPSFLLLRSARKEEKVLCTRVKLRGTTWLQAEFIAKKMTTP